MASSAGDQAFGPASRQYFDFTLTFEDSILNVVPSGMTIFIAPIMLYHYFQQPKRVRPGRLLWVKLACALTLVGFQIAMFLVRSFLPAYQTDATVAAETLDLASVLTITAVLYAEHRHAFRASAFLGLFLALGILVDGTKARSYFLRSGSHVLGVLSAVAGAIRLILLVLHELPKKSLLVNSDVFLGPESLSGYWMRTLFVWVNSTLLFGFYNVMKMSDLVNIGPEFSSAYLHSIFQRQLHKAKSVSNYTLIWLCFSTLRWSLMAILLPRLGVSVFSLSQPFILQRVVVLVGEENPSPETQNSMIGAAVLVFTGLAISNATTAHMSHRLLTRLRGLLVSHIIDKGFRLSSSQAKKAAAITLMTTDIDGIASGISQCYEVPVSIIEAGFGIYFLSIFIEKSCFFIILPVVAATAFGYVTGRFITPAFKLWSQSIQHRVAETSNIVSQLPAIKILGLGPTVAEYIQMLRLDEIDKSKRYRRLFAVSLGSVAVADALTPIMVVALCLFWHPSTSQVSAAQIYPTLAIVALIQTPLIVILQAYPLLMSMVGSFQRIQEFLQQNERVDRRVKPGAEPPVSLEDGVELSVLGDSSRRLNLLPGENALEFANVSLGHDGADTAVLENCTFGVPRGSTTVVLGSTGSGKSTLLRGMLGEMPALSGVIYVDEGDVAFCDEEAWLLNASIQDNIIGDLPYDERQYNIAVHACLLEEDIAALPGGNDYVVGSNGSKLSGGQRHRVALARAIFARLSLIILDNILNALDRKTAVSILYRLVGEGGVLKRQGCTVVLVTYLPECLNVADQLLLLDGNGHATPDRSFKHEQYRGPILEALRSKKILVAEETEEREQTVVRRSHEQDQSVYSGAQESPSACQRGDVGLYRLFIDSIGVRLFLGWLGLLFATSASELLPDIFMRVWIEVAPKNLRYFAGYALFGAASVVLNIVVNLALFIVLVPRAAAGLHERLTTTVARATIGYLNTTDSGVILNRYSQDMGLLSRGLPASILKTFYVFFYLVIQTGIILSGSTYMTALLPGLIVILYVIQRFYLRTSCQMRALDLEAKTPLYTQATETAQGLWHIRAYGRARNTLKRSLQILDDSQKPFYLMYCIQRWLGLVLDLVAGTVAVTLIAMGLKLKHTTSQAAIGLSLLQIILFATTLNRTINNWTDMETSVGALSRLRSFMNDTPVEPTRDECVQPPENWPHAGAVEIAALTARYSANLADPPVLNDVSLSIKPGQKVGFSGRTGSGKSSLFLSLLGFLEYSGTIKIDGVDISRLQPDELRARIVTISQQQVKLGGSIRNNLLPSTLNLRKDEAAKVAQERDGELQEILEHVGIWASVQNKGGLGAILEDVGLSNGEMQLLCIARAMLRKNETGSRLVLVDEATSSVDASIDERIQTLMRDEFAGCTILVIAHRLDSIADADIRVELAKGEILGTTDGRELQSM